MLFNDRKQAGEELAERLVKYKDQPQCLVVGLPRGGVVTAVAVAKKLHLPLDVVCPRKLGAPFNQEFAIGAITESGEAYLDQEVIRRYGVSPAYLEGIQQQQQQEAQRRLKLYRSGKPPIDFTDKTVILVDDGIATGATMKAAILSVKGRSARQVVVATPVIPPETVPEIAELADELIVIAAPAGFMAVGQFYRDFSQTTDAEVIELLASI